MTEEFKNRVVSMLRAQDPEMVELGITLLINKCTLDECRTIVPWNMYTYSENEKAPIPFDLSEGMMGKTKLWIKADTAIMVINGNLICRPTKLMEIYTGFHEIPKTIFDE